MEVTSNLVDFGSHLRFVSQGLTAVAQYVEEGGGEAQNTAGLIEGLAQFLEDLASDANEAARRLIGAARALPDAYAI